MHAVEEKNPKASGDDVMRAVVKAHGQTLKDRLIVEIGNAPAGYTQLAGALVLAQELGIDPSEAICSSYHSVELVHPKHFGVLDLERRSRVQNAATALNSFNGGLELLLRLIHTCRLVINKTVNCFSGLDSCWGLLSCVR